jgi:hypothetical protein
VPSSIDLVGDPVLDASLRQFDLAMRTADALRRFALGPGVIDGHRIIDPAAVK